MEVVDNQKVKKMNDHQDIGIKTKIIAEIASAHCGNYRELENLIRCSKSAGADYVKLQIFDVASLLALHDVELSDLKHIELEPSAWREALSFCEQLGVKTIIEPYDEASLDLALEFPFISGYKIPASETSNLPFIEKLSKNTNLILISAGGSKLDEISEALIRVREVASSSCEIVILHGIQSFPTLIEDSWLGKISFLASKFNVCIGYADHISAENVMGRLIISLMAIAKGATYIEKHITLDRSKKEYDYYSALDPNEFQEFIEEIRLYEKSIGEDNFEILNQAELLYRDKMKRFCILKEAVAGGRIFNEKDIIFRRTGKGGIPPKLINSFVGKIYKSNYPAGTILGDELFE
jgi:N,N'-diacetyllegionaminate synthase